MGATPPTISVSSKLIGDKAATDAAFARADHVVKQKFVINRVTAATMEPRGAVGDYNAADERYTLYTAIQRPHPTRIDFAKLMHIAGEQDPHRHQRYRRLVRHEVADLQRDAAWCCWPPSSPAGR